MRLQYYHAVVPGPTNRLSPVGLLTHGVSCSKYKSMTNARVIFAMRVRVGMFVTQETKTLNWNLAILCHDPSSSAHIPSIGYPNCTSVYSAASDLASSTERLNLDGMYVVPRAPMCTCMGWVWGTSGDYATTATYSKLEGRRGGRRKGWQEIEGERQG